MRLSTRSLVAFAALGLALGNLGRVPSISVLGRGGALVLMDLALLPLWTLLLVTLARGTRRWRLDAFALSFVAFVAIAALSAVLAGSKWDLTLGAHFAVVAFLIRWVAYGGWYLLVVTDPDPDAAGRDAWTFLERAILAILAFGILQSAFFPDIGAFVERVTGLYFDHQGRRLVSSVLDPNFAGGLLALVLMMRLAQEAEGIRTNRWVLFGLVLGILLTLSRATWLAVFSALVLLVLLRGLRGSLWRLAAVGTAMLLPAIPAIVAFGSAFRKFEIDASALQRVGVWLRGIALIREYPLLGVGFNAAGPAQWAHGWETYGGSTTSMDGGVLFVAVMTGLVGVTAYLAMLWFFFRAARRTWRDPSVPAERRAFALGGWLGMVVIVVQSLPANALLTPWLMLPLWVIQARVVATAPEAAPSTRSSLLLRWWRRRTLTRKLATTLPLAMLPLVLAACDPCAGVVSCTGASTIAATGTIVNAATKAPQAGVRVSIGTALSITDETGRWLLTLPAGQDSTVHIRVERPGRPPYVVPQRLRASRRIGEADDVGLWYDQPAFNSVIGVLRQGTYRSGATVSFEVEGGAAAVTLGSVAVAQGFYLLTGPVPNLGPVSGALVVNCCGLGTRRYPGFRVDGDYRVEIERVRGVVDVGRTYSFGGNLVNRGTRAQPSGATVTWTRTSGLGATPSTVTTTSGAGGFFGLSLDLHGYGESFGTLSVTPPGGPTWTRTNYRLATFADYNAQSLGAVGFGEQWIFLAGVRRASDSLPIIWTPVTFTRDSGLVITPGSIALTTSGDGRFYLGASVTDTGTVYGRLTFAPPGQPTYQSGTIALRTYNADAIPTLPYWYIATP